MMSWLRRRFITGFFVLVPLVISIVALIWVFGVVDGFTAPLYERYFTLESWRRAHEDVMGWFAAVPPDLLARFLREPTEETFLAVMGVLGAALRFRSGGVPRKDFRVTPALPGLATARSLFAELTSAPREDARPGS